MLPGEPREHLREVLRRFYEGGGRVVDTSPLSQQSGLESIVEATVQRWFYLDLRKHAETFCWSNV